jgi:O-antigen ligase
VKSEYSEEPILGHGFGAFWTEGKGRELVQTWNPRQSHHAYLDVLVELGAVGLVAVICVFPIGLLIAWLRHSGAAGSERRKAVSAMLAVSFAYMGIYAFGQSFFLRFDAFPFFVLAWITMILGNPDANNLDTEFSLGPKVMNDYCINKFNTTS